MVIEATLPAAERQQVGILDKCLLQPPAEAVGIKTGFLCLDNDIKVNRPQPGRSNRALVLSQKVDSVQNGSPCIRNCSQTGRASRCWSGCYFEVNEG
jgi:hypothetical protein